MMQEKKIYAIKSSSSRFDFPKGFLFGTASSAYQYEEAVNDASRGLRVWDTFVQKHPERNCYSDADQAVDFYHHYKEDIQRMKDIDRNRGEAERESDDDNVALRRSSRTRQPNRRYQS